MTKPIGILYEHPEWFRPLFAELDRRAIDYEPIHAQSHRYDPSAVSVPYALVVNRVSPSAYLREHPGAIFYARQYLAFLDDLGVPLVNGPRAYDLELSKARQLNLLARLGIVHPRSRVVNAVEQIAPAASELAYPLIVKPNIGGSGALMRRFDHMEDLELALTAGELDEILGLDQTAVVQEYHPTEDGSIVRVEVLDDRFLYAIRIYNNPSQGFNLCPADICQMPEDDDVSAEASVDLFDNCPVDAPKAARKIEGTDPPPEVLVDVLRIFRAAGIDIGGVEYLESARDGQVYIYDINALSNFVTDAPALVGFDPFNRFVDYLASRAGLGAPKAASARP